MNERAHFRVFIMPCCGQALCWVNPRLPNYCPECGRLTYIQLKSGAHTQIDAPDAWIRYKSIDEISF